MRVIVASFAVACLLACGSGDDAPVVTVDAAVVVAEPPVPQPPPPPEPTLVTQTRAWAVFVDDELDQCIEHTRRFEIPAATEWSPGPIEDLAPLPEGRVIELTAGCADSVEGRTVLASCESSADGASSSLPVPHEVTLLETFATQNFRFATALGSDARLEECLATHQHWSAVADDSPEYLRARARSRDRRSVTRR